MFEIIDDLAKLFKRIRLTNESLDELFEKIVEGGTSALSEEDKAALLRANESNGTQIGVVRKAICVKIFELGQAFMTENDFYLLAKFKTEQLQKIIVLLSLNYVKN